jgi:hypothetical protein
MACLWLALGQAPDEPFYSNQRGHKVPVNIEPARRPEIKYVLLYASGDQGRSWQIASTITPDKEFFAYYPPGDGTYRLKVAAVNQNDRQDPADPNSGPPDQIIVIDTAKPIFHVLEARRQGDEVVVQWQLQEEFPDWSSFRLEFQPRGAGAWSGIQAQPGLSGQARFRPDLAQALDVRLSLRDRAGNQSFATAVVAGNGLVAGTQLISNPSPPVAPVAVEPPAPAPSAPVQAPVAPAPSLAAQISLPMNPLPPTPLPPAPVAVAPPAPRALPPAPQAPAPAVAPPVEKVVADTQWPAAGRDPRLPAGPAGAGAPPAGGLTQVGGRRLPPVQYVSQQKVTLEFEVSKLGPSGVGSLQLWCTKNDGQSWEMYAEDRNPAEIGANGRQQLIVPLEEDGIYGFTLVVKNRAGLGKAPPRPGELPEMRLELDTTPPSAKLIAPEPDRDKPDAALLTWIAQDKNLGEKPISLEWAERREGPWQPIGLELPNDGRFSWHPPKDIPVQVYLRLRVRDAAGNEAVAVTREPQLIDLSEPEVRLINVIQPRRP